MRIEELSDEELVGRTAKVGFRAHNHAHIDSEWMWVRITRVDGERFHGELRNEPAHVPNLHMGDSVSFVAEDVFGGEAYVPGTEALLDPVSRLARRLDGEDPPEAGERSAAG